MPAGPSGVPSPRCSSTWRAARSTTRSTSLSAAATTTAHRPTARHGRRSIASFLCPSDNNAGQGGSPAFGTNNPPNINSYRGSVGTTSLAGWNNGPGLWKLPARPAEHHRRKPRLPAVLDRHVRLLDCLRHQRLAPTARHRPSPSRNRWSATRRDRLAETAK